METPRVISALAALAQETRLRIFRLLVEQGSQGMAAGAIGRCLGLPPATLSFHIKELAAARLVSSRPQGRFIHYATDFDTMQALIAYLTENCCRADGALSCATACEPLRSLARTAPGIAKPTIRAKWRVS